MWGGGARNPENTIHELILLDISMELIDGWETLERAKQNPVSVP